MALRMRHLEEAQDGGVTQNLSVNNREERTTKHRRRPRL